MRSLSASERSTWLECRLRWQYQYVTKPDVPHYEQRDLMRGSAGHAAMESYYSSEPAGRSLDMLLANAEQYLTELAESKQLSEYERADMLKAHTDVQAALKQFWQMFGRDVDVPRLQTEVRASRTLGKPHSALFEDWEFHAVLDGLDNQPDRAIIYENKFPLYPPQAGQYEIWSPQHRDYAWVLALDKPVFVVYNILSPNRAIRRGPLLVPAWQQKEAMMTNMVVMNDMENSPVYPHYGFHCQRCPYRELCQDRLAGGER